MNQTEPITPGDYAYIKGMSDKKVKILKKVKYDPRFNWKKLLLFPHYECCPVLADGRLSSKSEIVPLVAISSKPSTR